MLNKTLTAVLLFFLVSPALGEDLYYTETGGGSGASCVDPLDIDSIDWGSGAGKVDPGGTISLADNWGGIWISLD